MNVNWVLLRRYAELIGYTEEALRNKTKKGIWQYNVHFKKAPDGHIIINIEEVEKWLTSSKA